MRRTISYIILYVAVLILGACSETYDESMGMYPSLTPRFLSISPTDISFPANPRGMKQMMTVSSTGTPWKIDNTTDWVKTAPSEGTEGAIVNVVADEYTDTEEPRMGVLFLKANTSEWKYEMPITVMQECAKPYILPAEEYVELSGRHQDVQITIDSNCEWDAYCDCPWMTVGQDGNGIRIAVETNETGTLRQCSITLMYNKESFATATITIVQRPASLTATAEDLVFNNNASYIDLNIDAETAWRAETGNSWIDLQPAQGPEGTTTMRVSVTDNTSAETRTGYIMLFAGRNEAIEIRVRQRGVYAEAKQDKLLFDTKGGTQTLEVESNTSWTIESDMSWISLSSTSGSGDKQVSVSATENATDKSRTGQIRIKQADRDVYYYVTVEQKGRYFEVDNPLMDFESKGGCIKLSISTNCSWTGYVDADAAAWLSISKTSGDKDVEVTVTATDNATMTPRSGAIYFDSANGRKTCVNVIQAARYLNVSTSEVQFYDKGGTSELIHVTTNGSYSVTTATPWLKINESAGVFTLTATENTTTDVRMGTVTVKLTDLKQGECSVKVNVTQMYKGGSFIRQDFDEDKNWDGDNGHSVQLAITPYEDDDNWDSNPSAGTSIVITAFPQDQVWD